MSLSVAVAGATGRLGSFVCEVIESLPDHDLVAKLSSTSSPDEGAEASVLFDVTHPEISPEIVKRAVRRGQRVIVGTSGWSANRLQELDKLVSEVPGAAILVVPNFSLGSVLATTLSRIAAPHFESIEIIEAHHAAKVDSPSGTAVRTAELIGMAKQGQQIFAPHTDQLARGTLVYGIPVHSLRMRGVIARQEVHFGGEGEELTVTHATHSNDSYRAGIRAALTAISEIEGLVVGLERVLGLDRALGQTE